ncbi:CPCC family cysteine-rich protein [Brevundimonas sp. M20]|uniref:CPCC family cysteine-rich protein n=1 Tax=Brevundimonas sp. M20 TaxID=2591463 RepID=UPI0011469CDC|nr:CPCC family cysteine-rich protein [Brevundimonas sp. M20]QDH74548.1 hypothetical protein FKQ52_14630 [Brevundimonas sp. M20]
MNGLGGVTCACCGYRTLSEGPGGYEICRVCWWEDDPVQLASPLLRGGANTVSLAEAQLYFISAGVSDPSFTVHVRPPADDEVADPAWRPWNARMDAEGDRTIRTGLDYFHAVGLGPDSPYWLKA